MILKQDLKLKPYKMAIAQQLKPNDYETRVHACERIIEFANNDPEHKEHILMTDECLFTLDNTMHPSHCRVWSQSKPSVVQEQPMQPERILVWCGVSANNLIGPYYFDGPVNTDSYLNMLQEFLLPSFRRLRVVRRTVFQQDGAAAHTADRVLEWLHATFGDRVISRRCELVWPARSPDLTAPDFFLWGTLKGKIKQRRPVTMDELKHFLQEEITKLNRDKVLLRKVVNNAFYRMNECIRRNGGHIKDVQGCH